MNGFRHRPVDLRIIQRTAPTGKCASFQFQRQKPRPLPIDIGSIGQVRLEPETAIVIWLPVLSLSAVTDTAKVLAVFGNRNVGVRTMTR